MLKITDGVNEKIVTRGMFENLYSKMGYEIVTEKKAIKEEKPVVEEVEKPIKQEEIKRPEGKKGKK